MAENRLFSRQGLHYIMQVDQTGYITHSDNTIIARTVRNVKKYSDRLQESVRVYVITL